MTSAMLMELSSLLLMCLDFMDICLQTLESTDMLSMSSHYIMSHRFPLLCVIYLSDYQGYQN